MTDTGHGVADIDAVRRQTIDVLDELMGKASSFGLPAPPPACVTARLKLLDDKYRIAVVGEAKRGKSTFVNGLIGRPVLPTDVDIATSQVFLVHAAEEESYRLRFEDDSTKSITAADLPKYGSQVVADTAGIPPLDQIIRWIEVEGPVRFVPANFSLLDTPGLGSLYAAHAQITQRYVPYADAVIFVLDSGQPISQPELDFIKTILSVTGKIFFVQTKIDSYRKEQWQEIQTRNETILRRQFGDQLPDVHVWPIASTLLMMAAQSGDKTFLGISGHVELAAALSAFLYRVAGVSRSGQALMIAAQYYTDAQKTLEGRLAGVGDHSAQELAALRQRAEETRRRFDEEWSAGGPKRRQLMAAIEQAARKARQRYTDDLEQLIISQQVRIAGFRSIEDAEALAQDLSATVIAGAIDRWRALAEELRQQCIVLLTPFVQEADALSALDNVAEMDASQRLHLPTELTRNWALQSVGTTNDSLQMVPGLLQEAMAILALVGVIAPPIATVGGAAAAIWAAARHFILQRGAKVHAAQAQLSGHLAALTTDVRRTFLGKAYPSSGGSGLIDEYITALQQAVAAGVDVAAERKSREVSDELTRLAEEAQLATQERQAKAAQLQRQVTDWETLGQSFQGVAAELQRLDRLLATATLLSTDVLKGSNS